jgi:hypothetical protein
MYALVVFKDSFPDGKQSVHPETKLKAVSEMQFIRNYLTEERKDREESALLSLRPLAKRLLYRFQFGFDLFCPAAFHLR